MRGKRNKGPKRASGGRRRVIVRAGGAALLLTLAQRLDERVQVLVSMGGTSYHLDETYVRLRTRRK